jgi:hypothetical protein
MISVLQSFPSIWGKLARILAKQTFLLGLRSGMLLRIFHEHTGYLATMVSHTSVHGEGGTKGLTEMIRMAAGRQWNKKCWHEYALARVLGSFAPWVRISHEALVQALLYH